ncbi:MAG: hypothetical protein DRI61_12965, partial [Chloroflexi bacterium]
MTYDEFKQKMDDMLADFKEHIDWLKDNVKNWKDLIKHAKYILQIITGIIAAARAIAEEVGTLPDDAQHDYIARYVDGLIKFKNAFLEMVDYY